VCLVAYKISKALEGQIASELEARRRGYVSVPPGALIPQGAEAGAHAALK
jgi:hypothetical protein